MTDIRQMRAELESLRDTIEALGRELRDYYTERNALQCAVIQTHEYIRVQENASSRPPRSVVVGYSRERAEQRARLFAALDRLNQVYAVSIIKRRALSKEADSLARAIDRTTAWDAAHPQKDLFARVPA